MGFEVKEKMIELTDDDEEWAIKCHNGEMNIKHIPSGRNLLIWYEAFDEDAGCIEIRSHDIDITIDVELKTKNTE